MAGTLRFHACTSRAKPGRRRPSPRAALSESLPLPRTPRTAIPTLPYPVQRSFGRCRQGEDVSVREREREREEEEEGFRQAHSGAISCKQERQDYAPISSAGWFLPLRRHVDTRPVHGSACARVDFSEMVRLWWSEPRPRPSLFAKRHHKLGDKHLRSQTGGSRLLTADFPPRD